MDSKETSTCPRCVETVAKAEKCIREHPEEAAIASLSAGFLIAQLPLRLLMSALARLILLILKPAVVLYGIYRLAEDVYTRRPRGEDAEV